MDIVAGNIVKGEDLYGRKRELQLLWKTIEKDSLLLTSPRRYGKTSIVNYMKDNPQLGWSVTYIDMEGFADPSEFIIELLSHIHPTLLQKVKIFFTMQEMQPTHFRFLMSLESNYGNQTIVGRKKERKFFVN